MEGPSVRLIAQQLQKFCGHRITRISGNAHFEKAPFEGQIIKTIYAFGKRLIIQTTDYALVTHFLMYGSYRIDETRNGMEPRLALKTDDNALYFYSCSTKAYQEPNLQEKLNFTTDILSPAWNIAGTIALIQKHPNATIDDILLDQDIFSGVGNIIKNETLYLSRVKPTRKIKDLSLKKLRDISCNARLYSLQFLEQRKDFELRKHWTVYHKKDCPLGHRITRKKTGKRDRWSFFCRRCQK